MNKIYIGMDLHKSTSSFCVMNKEGEILKEQRIATTPESITRFIKSLGKKNKISITFEPVSQSWRYIDIFEEMNLDIHPANPRKLKAIATATSKTDKLDARVLADHLRTNHLPESYIPPKEVRGWKELVRNRSSLVRLRTQAKNRIHSALFKNGLASPFQTLWTARAKKWLRTLELESHFMLTIEKQLSVIEHLDKEIKDVEKTIKEIVKETKQMQLLKTIPGVGDIFAITIMSEIGDIRRFKNYKKLQSYAGLAPWVRNTGGKTWTGHITKRGSAWLRYAVIELAVSIARTRKSSDLKDYYLKVKRNKGGKTATVATARKSLAIIWAVLHNERKFEARYPAI